MIDACLPFNCVNSVYYLPMIDAIARMRARNKGPSFHALRGYLLSKIEVKISLELLVEEEYEFCVEAWTVKESFC